MNITISHDGRAVVLRIEPGDDGSPLMISGLVPGSPAGSSAPTGSTETVPKRSLFQSRPVRLLALGAVMLVFIQVGMVISGPSRTGIQPRDVGAPIAMFAPGGEASRRAGPPVSAAAAATAAVATTVPSGGGADNVGQTGVASVAPAIRPGSAQAQRQFGLDP